MKWDATHDSRYIAVRAINRRLLASQGGGERGELLDEVGQSTTHVSVLVYCATAVVAVAVVVWRCQAPGAVFLIHI